MNLIEWMRQNGARLEVRLDSELYPIAEEMEWRCVIRGVPNTSEGRPATFLAAYPDGPLAEASAAAATPGDAFREAVHQLRSLVIQITGAGRDETIGFPNDLTS